MLDALNVGLTFTFHGIVGNKITMIRLEYLYLWFWNISATHISYRWKTDVIVSINQSKPVTPRRRWGTRQMPSLRRPPIDACPLQRGAMMTSTDPSIP